jgi:ionotropic glutamate receptor
LAVDLSTAILQLSESGDLQRIHDKWMTRSTCSLDNTEIESDRLQLKSFWGLFIICGMACFIALVIHFLQILLQLRHSGTSESASNVGPIQRFLSLIDEKESPSRSERRKRNGDEISAEDQLGRQSKRIQRVTAA